MELQSRIPQDLENVDFDKEVVTFSPLPDPPCNPNRNSPEQSATVPKNVVHLPPTSRQNPGFGGGPYITKNNQYTQDPQHAGDPSYLGVGRLATGIPPRGLGLPGVL